MMEKFIKSDKPYLAARYSKKKVGIGIGGGGAIMFLTPRAGDDFDDEMVYTIELMRHANVMYEMLASIKLLAEYGYSHSETGFELISMMSEIDALLAKARGE